MDRAVDGPADLAALVKAVDQARESAEWHSTCQLFARLAPLRDQPSAGDLRYLRWLARAFGEVEATLGPAGDEREDSEEAAGPRRALLLGEAHGAALPVLSALR